MMTVWFLHIVLNLPRNYRNKQTGNNPTLIRIETDAGHGAGTPVSKTIEQYADIYGFTLYNMGFEVLPSKLKG